MPARRALEGDRREGRGVRAVGGPTLDRHPREACTLLRRAVSGRANGAWLY